MVLVSSGFGVAVCALEHRKVRWVSVTGVADAVSAAVIGGEPSVIKSRIQPGGGGVAGLARGRKSCRYVVGVGCSLVVLLMTPIAGGRQSGEIVVHVATGAGQRGVGAGQRERRVVVVKCRARPRGGVVTGVAGLGETCCRVVRIGRALVILQVTVNASTAGQVVVSVYVTLGALQAGVETRQGESRGRVVESGSRPGRGAMATVTSLREALGHVVGIGRALVIL